MKFAPAIVIALAAVFLALAEAAPATFDKKEIRDKILNQAENTVKLTGKLIDKYAELAEDSTHPERMGKYALVSKLFDSIGGHHWNGYVFTSNDDLVGENAKNELITFQLHADSLDQEIDGKLETLVRLADELPAKNGLSREIQKVVKSISDDQKFIKHLSIELSKEQ